ncbi:uncharacterized protein LOC124819521 [Vigna umbellata]|uniref:uncharacterized protein LOC124819521 n=1 Tax=Vigna umbellata TaxID=87088 RepID=UPI001F5FF169|nr:uncharacterized protein LOC124819521 [Vigna umbellata]
MKSPATPSTTSRGVQSSPLPPFPCARGKTPRVRHRPPLGYEFSPSPSNIQTRKSRPRLPPVANSSQLSGHEQNPTVDEAIPIVSRRMSPSPLFSIFLYLVGPGLFAPSAQETLRDSPILHIAPFLPTETQGLFLSEQENPAALTSAVQQPRPSLRPNGHRKGGEGGLYPVQNIVGNARRHQGHRWPRPRIRFFPSSCARAAASAKLTTAKRPSAWSMKSPVTPSATSRGVKSSPLPPFPCARGETPPVRHRPPLGYEFSPFSVEHPSTANHDQGFRQLPNSEHHLSGHERNPTVDEASHHCSRQNSFRHRRHRFLINR